jgi:hypothetical protein
MKPQVKKSLLLLLGAALVALAAFAFAGCGGGGDDEEQPDSLSKAEYIKEADKICAKTEGRQRKLLNQFGRENESLKPGQAATEKMISFAALPPMEEQIAELNELPPPDKEAAKAKAYIDALEFGLKEAEKQPGALLAQPGAFTKAEEASNAFGFKTCGGA